MNLILVDVALPVPLPQLFTYIVPPLLQPAVSPGTVVTVPFGKKILNGVVMAFRPSAPEVTLKKIINAAPEEFSIDAEGLSLAQWISEYYHAPIGETVKLFLPVGFQTSSRRLISFVRDPDDDRALSVIQRTIVDLLRKGPMSVAQLQKKSGRTAITSVLASLENSGIIRSEEVRGKTPTAKVERYFRKVRSGVPEPGWTKKQAEVWELVNVEEEDEIHVASFLKKHRISSPRLAFLEKKGWIRMFHRSTERRSPFLMDDQTARSISITANAGQAAAVQRIVDAAKGNSTQTFLLHGVTGSGKTQVYIEALRHVIAAGQSAIILIPEISLTPQTVKRFQIHFGAAVVWIHSRMSDGERYDAWRSIKQGKYSVVIGPRSAIFAPVRRLGLVIVDEEHEASYKQFDATPRYNARDVAIVRASLNNAVVVLGSATPSVESYANAAAGKYSLLSLPDRADNAVLPPVTIVNMVEVRQQLFAEAKIKAKEEGKKAFANLSRSISPRLEEAVRIRLEKKEGTIILQNRRGFAPFIECTSCGHVEQCDKCNVTMTYHATKKHMRCHYCGTVRPSPTTCTNCGGFEFSLNGFGTQRVEQELHTLFPAATVLRMDMDTTSRKGAHEKLLHQFGNGEADILLGTQMVAKGLDFPRVTLVGVISADTQMMLPDFRSAERTFQLLTQVAGRAGRSVLAGEVIIQTSQPNHYALKHVVDHRYEAFFREEIAFREALRYPPYSRLIVVEFKGRQENNVSRIAASFGTALGTLLPKDRLLGPSPAVLSKIKNEYRWHMIVKADKETDKNGTRARNSVARALRELQSSAEASNVKIIIDVDPAGIL